jgi:hypothetical protein
MLNPEYALEILLQHQTPAKYEENTFAHASYSRYDLFAKVHILLGFGVSLRTSNT